MAVVDRWHKRVEGKKVRTARYGQGLRWLVRWRDGDEVQRSKSFATRDEAEEFWAAQRAAPKVRDARRTVEDQWRLWIAARGGLKPNTVRDYRLQWRRRVQPRWGKVQMADIRHDDVASWMGGLSAEVSASTVRRTHVVLSGIVRMAVRSRVIREDPTAGIRLPDPPRRDMRVVTIQDVRRLADECAPHQLVVWTLALTGIRWGELCALTPADLDTNRRRLRISRALVEIDGRITIGTPKTRRARDVPVPQWLVAELTAIDGPWLFPTGTGGHWRQSTWRRIWRRHRDHRDQWVDGATERAGLTGLRVHDLRHAFASLAIDAGADPTVVQRGLGHASASMTLDRYRHLWDDRLDEVADRMGQISES